MTAFEKYLIKESGGDRVQLAGILITTIMQGDGQMTWQLLEETGDTKYTKETFLKAADNILKRQGLPD